MGRRMLPERTWNKYLVERLIKKVGFKQSEVDECVFYKGKTTYALYRASDRDEIDRIVQEIKDARLDITEEGDIQDFIGENITRKANNVIKFKQPVLIQKIVDAVYAPETWHPERHLRLAHAYSESTRSPNRLIVAYRSVVGMLNYLEKATRSDIAYAMHQCTRFASGPWKEHRSAVRWLVRYLSGRKDKGLTFVGNGELGLEVFVDADFAGNWDKEDSLDRDTARSRHGYIIRYCMDT